MKDPIQPCKAEFAVPVPIIDVLKFEEIDILQTLFAEMCPLHLRNIVRYKAALLSNFQIELCAHEPKVRQQEACSSFEEFLILTKVIPPNIVAEQNFWKNFDVYSFLIPAEVRVYTFDWNDSSPQHFLMEQWPSGSWETGKLQAWLYPIQPRHINIFRDVSGD